MTSKHTCSICLNNFTKPKLLPCHHTFCELCIADYISFKKFNCPICRQEAKVPKGGVSKFANNFYLEDDDDDNGDKQYCRKHKKREIEVYCRSCSKPCCSICVMVDHKDHTLADLADVDMEMRPIFMQLKTISEEKIKQLQEHSNFLKTKISDMNNSCKTACKRVDKQIDSICKKAKKIGGTIKRDINKISAEENSKFAKVLDDVETMISKMKESCEYADRILLHRCIITTVDTQEFEDAQIRTDYNISTCLYKPAVRHPYYSMEKVDVECLKQLLGDVQTMDGSTFTSSFSLKQLKPNEMQDGNYVIIHELPWCIRVKVDPYALLIFLGLEEIEDDRFRKIFTASSTVKLININDESKSVYVRRDSYSCTHGDDIYIIRIVMDELQDGFLDNSKTFTVQATVNIENIQRLF